MYMLLIGLQVHEKYAQMILGISILKNIFLLHVKM